MKLGGCIFDFVNMFDNDVLAEFGGYFDVILSQWRYCGDNYRHTETKNSITIKCDRLTIICIVLCQININIETLCLIIM